MVFAALLLKMMIQVIKLSGTKTDGELSGARGIPCFQRAAAIYISLAHGLRARSRAEMLCNSTVGRSTQTLNLSVLELLDLFMLSLDITRIIMQELQTFARKYFDEQKSLTG